MTVLFRNKILLILTLLGLGLFLLLQLSVKPTISDDSPGYIQCAMDISHGNFKVCDPARTPGYSFMIFLTDTVFGGLNYQLTVFLQALMVLGTAYFVYRLSQLIFNNQKVAYLSFFLTVTNPLFLFYSNNLLTEVPFLFFLTGFVYYFIQYLYQQRNRYLVLLALFLGIATLVRPLPQYFLFLVILVLFVMHYKTLGQLLKKGLIVAAIFTLLVGPWIWKNSVQYHEKTLTIFFGYSLWVNVFRADKLPLVDSNLFPEEKAIIKQKGNAQAYTEVWHMLDSRYQNPVTVDRIMKKISLETIKHYPLDYLKGSLINFLKITFYPKYSFGDYLLKDQQENLRAIPPASYLYYAFKDLMHKVNYPVLIMTLLGIFGLGQTFRKQDIKTKMVAVIFTFIILVILVIPSILTVPNVRYRVITEQFFILFGSYGLVHLWSRYELTKRLTKLFNF